MHKISSKIPTAFPKTLLKVLRTKIKEVAVIALGTAVLWHHRDGDDLALYTSVGLKYYVP